MRCDACGAVTDPVWRWCPVCGRERQADGRHGRDERLPVTIPGSAFAVEWSLPAAPSRALVA